MGLRDMYSAISGLQANSTWLDVIGNNIANMSTVGYKASRVEFADAISQTLSAGTGDNPGSNIGGTDPMQIGLGTRVASIQTLWSEGTLQQTGVSTDVAINGNGFLVAKSGDQTFLTRAGNLTFDSNGNLVDANGGLIQGFTASIQYTQTEIDTAADSGTTNLFITNAQLKLNNTNPSGATNINISSLETEPPKATTQVNFVGNLDAFQQADQTGGVLDIGGNGANPVLPLGNAGVTLGGPFAIINNPNGATGQVVQQNANANTGVTGAGDAAGIQGATTSSDWTQPYVTGAVGLANVQANAGSYAWDQQPPISPAKSVTETVYDSNGNPRQVTIQFYQVNDLGEAGINNPSGPNQVAYAWYAFDTTNGAAVSTATLVGGTGIIEGDTGGAGGAQPGYDRGVTGDEFWGDLVVFNTDGSLLSTGGVESVNGVGYQSMPDIYLPPENTNGAVPGANGTGAPASPLPTQGAEISQVQLNFGNAGVLGFGQRNGLYSDADGSYQVVNGVNTYEPSSTAYASSQNGYAEGQLQSISFDSTGTIQASYSNGQTTAIGQVVLAMPANEGGLTQVGNNYYQTSSNSGALFVGTAGQNGLGSVEGGTLEESNVDLTTELTNMIIAQRGFDVNSRVIAVENSNLQILSQLGQGG